MNSTELELYLRKQLSEAFASLTKEQLEEIVKEPYTELSYKTDKPF